MSAMRAGVAGPLSTLGFWRDCVAQRVIPRGVLDIGCSTSRGLGPRRRTNKDRKQCASNGGQSSTQNVTQISDAPATMIRARLSIRVSPWLSTGPTPQPPGVSSQPAEGGGSQAASPQLLELERILALWRAAYAGRKVIRRWWKLRSETTAG